MVARSLAHRGVHGHGAPSVHIAAPESAVIVVAIVVGIFAFVALWVAFTVWLRMRSEKRRTQQYEELQQKVPIMANADAADAEYDRPYSPHTGSGSGGDEDIEAGFQSPAAPPPPPPPPPSRAPGSVNVQREPPPIVYSPLELRQMLDDGDTSHCWAPLHPRSFQVRGPSYLSDGKKMPSSQGSLLLAVEFFRAASAVQDVAGRADSPAHTLQQRCASKLSLVFVVNLSIPAASGVYQVVFYFGLLAEESPSAAGRLLERFVSGSDAFRSARLKLIPGIAEGPWLVRQGVGSRPAILGKTLRQRFHRGEGYFEVDIDCNSSPAAGRIVSLVKSYAKSLAVDLAFVIEAQTAGELPERVLGCGRLCHVELDDEAVPLYPGRAGVLVVGESGEVDEVA